MVRTQCQISERLASEQERKGLHVPLGSVRFHSNPSAKACVMQRIPPFPVSQKDTEMHEFVCRHTHENANMLQRFCVEELALFQVYVLVRLRGKVLS